MLFYSKILHALAIIFVPHRFHLQPVLSFNCIIAMEKFGRKWSSDINHYYHRLRVCDTSESRGKYFLPVNVDTQKTAFTKASQMAGAGKFYFFIITTAIPFIFK